MKTKYVVSTLLSIALYLSSYAQSCDPWITRAYKELYQRNPNSTECNIRNYNNGSWRSYSELVGYIKTYNKNKTANAAPVLKGDPWIFQIYKELYNRQPNAWELNINNYNGGSWNSYASLKNYITEFQNSLRKNKLDIKTANSNGKIVVVFQQNGRTLAVNLVSAEGGSVVAAGGANVISAGGGNVVSAGGLNLRITSGMAGVSFGSKYRTQSAGTTIIPSSGNGALVIR